MVWYDISFFGVARVSVPQNNAFLTWLLFLWSEYKPPRITSEGVISFMFDAARLWLCFRALKSCLEVWFGLILTYSLTLVTAWPILAVLGFFLLWQVAYHHDGFGFNSGVHMAGQAKTLHNHVFWEKELRSVIVAYNLVHLGTHCNIVKKLLRACRYIIEKLAIHSIRWQA